MQSDDESNNGPRPLAREKGSSSNQPVTCNITSYSTTDISRSITNTVFNGLMNDAEGLNIVQSSIIYGSMTYTFYNFINIFICYDF